MRYAIQILVDEINDIRITQQIERKHSGKPVLPALI